MDLTSVILAKLLAGKTSGSSVGLSIDDEFKLSATLKNKDGEVISTSPVVDLPLKATVVGGSYNSSNESLVLELQNGNTIDIPVSALIDGLVSEADFNLHVNSTAPHPNDKKVRYNDKLSPEVEQFVFEDEELLTAGVQVYTSGGWRFLGCLGEVPYTEVDKAMATRPVADDSEIEDLIEHIFAIVA